MVGGWPGGVAPNRPSQDASFTRIHVALPVESWFIVSEVLNRVREGV